VDRRAINFKEECNMRARRFVLVAGLSAWWVGVGHAVEPAASPLAQVGGHFGLHGPTYSHRLTAGDPLVWAEGEALLHVLRDSGAGWARQDFWWSLVEPQRGTYRWADFDRVVDAYHRHGIQLFAILCYSSAWSGGACPETDTERAAFAAYVRAMVGRYRGKVAAWEIWNEPNIQPFWSPRPDPALYAALLAAAYDAAKSADPDCVIVAGALAGPDAEFLEGMYAHGAAGKFDVLSYHNYGQQLSMATEWPAVERLRAVMARHGDAEKPIWHTENGFYTGPVGVSEAAQGARIVRYSIGLLALGIEKTFQLTLHDWTDDPQHHDLSGYRGITRASLARKPSFAAYRTMCRNLNDKHLAASFEPAPGIAGFLFEQVAGPERVAVFWRKPGGPAEPVTLHLDAPAVLIEQIDGDGELHRSDDRTYTLPIGDDPVYVLNPGPAVARRRLVQWPNPVLSRLPRESGASLAVTVTNPTAGPLHFTCAHAAAARAVAPGRTAALDIPLDLSQAKVGAQTIAWTLSRDAEGRDPWVRGHRAIDVRAPFELSFGPLAHLAADAPTLPAVVAYHGSRPVEAKLRLRVDDQPTAAAQPVTLAPGSRRTVPLPFELASFAGKDALPLAVELASDDLRLTARTERKLIACPPAPPVVQVDGVLSEWENQDAHLTPAMFQWAYVNAVGDPAPGDLAVRGWLGWSAAGLHIALAVADDSISLAKGRAVWNWDSVQIGLDLAADAPAKGAYDANDLEIELARGADGKLWCYLGHCPAGWPIAELERKLEAAVTVDAPDGRVIYELRIPAELIVSQAELAPGSVMGFSIMVNDNDADGRAGWLELTPGIGMGKQPAKFAWLWLRD
jgi:hypothetical protein